jgi:hypothetical protein
MSFDGRDPPGLVADVFFIVLLLSSCRFTSADDSNSVPKSFHETHQQQPIENRIAHNDFSFLAIGMIFIWKDYRPNILENGARFLKLTRCLR